MKYCIKHLHFDTEIFNIKCSKVELTNEYLSENDIKCLLEDAKERKIDHLVATVPSEHAAVCNLLEDFSFRFKVCSLYLEKLLTTSINNADKDVSIYNGDDDERLIEITEKAFSSGTRFHFEQCFTSIQVAELHKRWINNLINDRNVQIYVHLQESEITGYVTVKPENSASKRSHIGLFAVDKPYLGNGIGTKLLSALNSHLCNKIDIISVTTESFNYSALKTYFKHGFTINKSQNIFHLSFK